MARLATLVLTLAVGLAACTTAKAPPPGPSISFYEVDGTTAAALNYELHHNGPLVPGEGRALAAAAIAITPMVILEGGTGFCLATSTKAEVNANITLPRRQNRRAAQAELNKAWSSLEQYAQAHELMHVAIAEKYAEMLEARLRALPHLDSCAALRARVTQTIGEVMALHARAQDEFDAGEQERIARLVRQVQLKSG